MQPVYVFDHSSFRSAPRQPGESGYLSGLWPRANAGRAQCRLHSTTQARRRFDELILPDGRRISLHANVVPGSGQVVRLVTADQHKKNVVKDAAAQKMDQARAQWNNAMKQVESPGRMHLVTRYAVAQLPAHPQYIDAGTLYFAELSQPLDFGSESVSSKTLSAIGTQPPPEALSTLCCGRLSIQRRP